MTARDAYGNVVTAFSGAGNTVVITDTTGTIDDPVPPLVSGVFTAGVLAAQSVTVTAPWVGNVITVTDSAGGLGTGTETGVSNGFNVEVNPAALAQFAFTTQPVATYLAGGGIVVRIEAQDSLGNLITGFNGTATISDLTGTVNEGVANPPGPVDTVIAFVNGVYNNGLGQTLFVTGARVGDILTVTRGGISRDSNAFDVQPNVLDSFSVTAAGGGAIGTQKADTAFGIDLTARDVYGNVLSFGANVFRGTVAISDVTGTIAPVVIGAFVAGVRAESVQVTQSAVGDVITVVSGGRSGVSNAFTVGAGALDHFTYTTQPVGPYLAGAGIVVRIEARDVYDNLLTGYTQGVVVSDSTGTVSEGTPNSGDTVIAFSGGVYNNALAASLFITKAQGGVQLTVSDSGKVGVSAAFVVKPAVLHHFGVGAIGGQVADTAFNVVITAYDVYNNVLSSGVNNFNGAGNTVAISDSTGTITPVVSGVFTNGVLTRSWCR